MLIGSAHMARILSEVNNDPDLREENISGKIYEKLPVFHSEEWKKDNLNLDHEFTVGYCERTLLESASMGNFTNVMHYLIKAGASVDMKNANGNTVLHTVSTIGLEDGVRILINNNASIDAQDQNNHAPLHLAVANNHVRIVERLIEQGAKVNICNVEQQTPLHLAVNKEIENLLLKGGADPSLKDLSGHTPEYYSMPLSHFNNCS
ncbi:hypothetical protein BIY23_00955 [Wolbachia pipientis]|uniref:Uncharacterized protein n=1 Tax=Wolbachia pipientis TaxID=955 RepID=A0A1E7QKN7_WOLPI|nr:ankyrin repeat domain-containing protein [Wolbachia pipientis]OEY87042.1 hypothetical protein BIY23_00955 [Wolbachia pipientis]